MKKVEQFSFSIKEEQKKCIRGMLFLHTLMFTAEETKEEDIRKSKVVKYTRLVMDKIDKHKEGEELVLSQDEMVTFYRSVRTTVRSVTKQFWLDIFNRQRPGEKKITKSQLEAFRKYHHDTSNAILFALNSRFSGNPHYKEMEAVVDEFYEGVDELNRKAEEEAKKKKH